MNKICWKGRAFKALSYGKKSNKAGRNFSGSITIFHRGGGAKRLLRRIDFQRKNLERRGSVERIEYDPNRTARIALVRWTGEPLLRARPGFRGEPVATQSLSDLFQESAQHKSEAGPKLFSVEGARREWSRLWSYSPIEQNILFASEGNTGLHFGLATELSREVLLAKPIGSSVQQTQSSCYTPRAGSQSTPTLKRLVCRKLDSDEGPLPRSIKFLRGLGPHRIAIVGPASRPVKDSISDPKGAYFQRFVSPADRSRRSTLSTERESLSAAKVPKAGQKALCVAVSSESRFSREAPLAATFSYILASDQLKSGDEVLNIDTRISDLSASGNRFTAKTGPLTGVYGSNSRNAPLRDVDAPGSPRALFLSTNIYQKSGISLPLWLAPIGSVIHNIELYPGRGGKLARAAGTYAQLVQKEPDRRLIGLIGGDASTASVRSDISPRKEGNRLGKPATFAGAKSARDAVNNRIKGSPAVNSFGPEYMEPNYVPPKCTIRLPSGQQQLLDLRCRATIGVVSNVDHRARVLRKAGQSRWMGFRPVVRGVAMNPIDHPHGGGEGRTKGGRPSVSPWGKPTKAGFRGSQKGLRNRQK